MADLVSFAAMHYNPAKISNMNDVICPPYDTLGEENQEKFREIPYNYIHVTLPDGDENVRYRNAMNKMFSWLLRDIVIVDSAPRLYIYEMVIPTGQGAQSRIGVVSLLRLEEYGPSIKKLEAVTIKEFEDRYTLLKETQIQFDPIFSLYSDPADSINQKLSAYISGKQPLVSATDPAGVKHQVYLMEDAALITETAAYFKQKPIYIADGQHRYEAALKLRNEIKAKSGNDFKGDEPCNFILAALFNSEERSMAVAPYNRLVSKTEISGIDLLKKLDTAYKAAVLPITDPKLEKPARRKIRALINEYAQKNIMAFGFVHKSIQGKYFVLALKDQALAGQPATSVLETSVLAPILNLTADNETIEYHKDDDLVFDAVKEGRADMAFLVARSSAKAVLAFADKEKLLPLQSVHFYPGMASGLLLYSFKYSPVKQ